MPGPRGLRLSGAGRYADPWHRYRDTSPLICAILGNAGDPTVTTTAPQLLRPERPAPHPTGWTRFRQAATTEAGVSHCC